MASLFAGTPQTAPSYAATTSDVPKWLQDYTVDLFSQQRAVSATPYQPYALPRIAQTTAPTTAAQNLITSSSGAYQPAMGNAITGTQGLTSQQAGTTAGLGYLQQAAGMSGINAAQPYLNAAGQTATTNIGQYMNPYTQNVTDQIATLGARNLSENLLPAVSDQFIRAGQFGSSGMGAFGGRALRDTQEAILNQQNQALQAGYSQALGASQADLARQGTLASTAGQLTQAGQQNLGTIGTQTAATAQAEAQRQAAAQQQVADLAKMQQGLTTADAAALESVGTAQQQQAQRGLDVAYQDYQNQINYPQTQINNMSTTLRGLPPTAVPTTGTQTGYTTTFAPSPLSGIAAAYGTYKGLTTAAKGGLIQGYADGGAVTADPSAQELSDLEKSVMADYGQYHYKTIDLPNKLVNPTAMPNWAKVIARRPNAEAQRAKQLAILSSHLPAGVKMVGNQLQIDDTYSKYSLDNPAQLYNSVRQYANQQNNLDLYNAKLAKEGKPAVTEIPKRLGLNPMAAQSRNINFGIPNFNVLADPFSDSARIRSGINLGNVGMGGLGLGMRMNAKKPYTPLIANEGTRSMDDALQQYLNKGGNNMSLDALKQQIALGKAPAPTIDPQELYSAPNVPAAPDMSSQLADLNAKYYSQPVAMSHGGRVPGYAQEGYVDAENPAPLAPDYNAQPAQQIEPSGGGAVPMPAALSNMNPEFASLIAQYGQGADYSKEIAANTAARREQDVKFNTAIEALKKTAPDAPSQSEMWFKLAAAFADPGKTGSFGEGMGHAAAVMGEHRAETRKGIAAQNKINTELDLKQQQYALENLRDEGTQLRSLQGEASKEKREMIKAAIKDYVDSGKPQSEAGKIALDEGLKRGTPAYEARVSAITKQKLDNQLGALSAQLGSLAVQQQRVNLEQIQLEPDERKSIRDDEDAIHASKSVVKNLDRAMQLNDMAFTSTTADRATYNKLRNTNPNDPRVKATEELENLIGTNVVGSLKSSYGGNPTEGERAALKELGGLGSANKEVRAKIFQRSADALKEAADYRDARIKKIESGGYRRKTSTEGKKE